MNDRGSSRPLLAVEGLTVSFGSAPVIEDLAFSVHPGRTLGIIGESGSGKSMTALSVMRLADLMGAAFGSGSIVFDGRSGPIELLRASQKEMRSIRGAEISMIFQEPMTSLNPVFTVGDQLSEVLALHEGMGRAAAEAESVRLLDMVRLPDSKQLLRRYPHELSGGMRQRIMISMALACRPKLLIADEPTTALDVTIQAQILSIIRELQKELGMTVIFITHDMGVIAEMADEVVVMRKGKRVEAGPLADIFRSPREPYTRALLAAVPKLGGMTGEAYPKRFPAIVEESAPTGDDSARSGAPQDLPSRAEEAPEIHDTAKLDAEPILSVRDLVVRFDIRKNILGRTTHRVHAVEKVSFDIHPGETLALVGESGSGKSTIGRTIQQLQKATAGNVLFEGKALSAMGTEERRRLQQRIQYVFQDPFASLDPRRTVGYSVSEPIRVHGLIQGERAIRGRVGELLERVGLDAAHASRYPHEFSGGQRQRICVARALASNPRLIIADEALSAMDVSIQAQIINLFMELQAERGLAYLFISHDMAVVERISHRIAVLYLGQIVEIGSRSQVLETPQHPYTKKLIAAVPVAEPGAHRVPPSFDEEIPSAVRPGDYVQEHVALREYGPGHFVAHAV